MRKLLNNPWLVGAVTALLPIVIALPWGWAVLGVLRTPVQTRLWVLLAGPITGAVLVLAGQVFLKRLRGRRPQLSYSALYWEQVPNGEGGFRPMCEQCHIQLEPRTEPERRLDKNGVPFSFTPDYANTLYCLRCKNSTPLGRPWPEIKREAEVYFASPPPRIPPAPARSA